MVSVGLGRGLNHRAFGPLVSRNSETGTTELEGEKGVPANMFAEQTTFPPISNLPMVTNKCGGDTSVEQKGTFGARLRKLSRYSALGRFLVKMLYRRPDAKKERRGVDHTCCHTKTHIPTTRRASPP